MAIGKSAKWYQERARLTDTRRGPTPKYNTGSNRLHTYPVNPPLPLPQLLPDTGPTDGQGADVWPHGTAGEQPV